MGLVFSSDENLVFNFKVREANYYHKIIDDERLAMKLRPDNYAILLYLTNNEDPEL